MTTQIEAPTDLDDDFDATGAFLDNLTGKKPAQGNPEASAEPAQEPQERPEAEPEADAPAEPDGDSGEPQEAPEGGSEDDPEVEVKIGDQAQKLKHSDIRDLVEKRAEVERQAQAIAQASQEAAQAAERSKTALTKAIERAQARFAPYKDLNLFLLSKQMDDASFAQLTKDIQEAAAEVQFYQQELDALVQAESSRVQQEKAKAAQAALAVIQNPNDPRHIPNFGPEVANQLVEFALRNGVDRATIDNLTDPGIIKLVHLALQFDQGAKAAARVRPVVHKPTKQLKPGSATSQAAPQSKRTQAINTLRRTGSEDAAVDAFLASFQRD